jgi:drug/metabolite transporter (DMT)-like permease
MHRGLLLAYVTLAVVWGVSFVLVLRTVEAFGWVGAVGFRALIACAVLTLAALVTRRRLDFGGQWFPLAVVGATTVTGQLLGLAFATPRIGTAMTAILVGTIPLFTMVIGQAWGIERITPAGRIGVLIGMSGIVVLVGFPAVPVTGDFVLGCATAVFGCVCAAVGSNWARRHLREIGSWEQSIGVFLFGGLLALPFLVGVPVPTAPRPIDIGYLVLLAAMCSSLAYVLYFRLIAEVGATIAVSVEFGTTTVAVFVGAVVLAEPLTLMQLVGGGVIIAGCALVLGLLPLRRRAVVASTG